jgi:tetratricopeptide (TPR) repeat protein
MVLNTLRARIQHLRALQLWDQTDHQAAIELATAALNSFPARRGGTYRRIRDRVGVLLTLATFATALADHAMAERRLLEAVSLLRSAKSGRARDARLCEALVGYGNLKRLTARHDTALEILHQALQIAHQRQLSRQVLAGCHNALGILARDEGRYSDAKMHYRQTQRALEACYGKDSPMLASLHHNLAGLAYAQHRFIKAEAPARRALSLRSRAANPDLLAIAADTSVLGAILAAQGRHDEAETLLNDALETWRCRFGPHHYEVAVQLHNKAIIQEARGDDAASEQSLLTALQIKRQTLGDCHPEVEALLSDLSAMHERHVCKGARSKQPQTYHSVAG